MKVVSLRVNHLESPLGYELGNPTFSWIAEGAEENTESRLQVWDEESLRADTGWGKLDRLCTRVDLCLKPRTRYFWRVKLRNGQGETAESELQTFETGKMGEPWVGRWITCEEQETRMPIFSRKFGPRPFGKKVRAARLYICGLGLYEARLDGRRVGEDYLTPGCFSYHRWLQAQTWDVTEMVDSGREHTLSVLLGKGWYLSRFAFTKDGLPTWSGAMKLLAELRIRYEDGTEETLGTDESWSVTRSNLVDTGIYDGEIRDDTLPEIPAVPAKPCAWNPPKMHDRMSIPVRAHEVFIPRIIRTPAGETVLDVGQNLAGIFRMRVHMARGKKLRLLFGEALQDGCFSQENLRGARAEYVYISGGEPGELSPCFTYYGFRYVRVEGAEDLKPEDFQAIALYSDVPMTGRMKTGHEKINRLISNVTWSMKSNFMDIPTDCPQRDERMGWTGDAQIFSETAMYLCGAYPFYRKYLFDMSEAQAERDGCVPNTVPPSLGSSAGAVWGDAACIIPWNLYVFTGDRSILEERFESMRAWVEYIRRTDGEEHHWRQVYTYGDWLALDSPYPGENQTRGGTDEGFIADVYYRKSVLILSRAARVLGRDALAEEYEALGEKILRGIRDEYFSANGRCCIPTQTAALLTLDEGLHRPDRAVQALRTLLENREDQLTTGFVGTAMLCRVLGEHGLEDKAFRLLLNEDYPGWLYEVNLGATTVWERWNSLDSAGHFSSTGMNSLNHYAYGAVAAWLWNGCAGLRPDPARPGFRHGWIRPLVHWKLGELEAEYPSPMGQYRIYWKVWENNEIELRLEIPAGCDAEVTLPCAQAEELRKEYGDNPLLADIQVGRCHVGSGTYVLRYPADRPLIRHLSVDAHLRALMSEPTVREKLHEFIPDLDYLYTYTGDYPLRETMTNLGYPEDQIRKMDEAIREIPV